MAAQTIIRNIQSGHVQTAIYRIDGGPYRYRTESRSHLRNITPAILTNSWEEATAAVADQVAELSR